VGALTLLAGCAENAIFELEVHLPPTGESSYTRVLVIPRGGVREAEFGDTIWADFGAEFALEATPSVARVSIEGSGANLEAPLGVRVIFCSDAGECIDGAGRERVDLLFERAFYRGRRTSLGVLCIEEGAVRIGLSGDCTAGAFVTPSATPQSAPLTVPRCMVACADDPDTTLTEENCSDGRHFCE
jgi:hypothetical protein